MSLINCKDCGKLHIQTGASQLCFPCSKSRSELTRTVRSYLAAHPKSSVMDVHRELGIPLAKLLEFQRENAYLAH